MRSYQLVLVLKPGKETERKKVLDTIKGWLKTMKTTREDDWGEKAFAYPIKRQTSGFYQLLHLEGETFPTDFEKKVFANESVLRHLLIRTK